MEEAVAGLRSVRCCFINVFVRAGATDLVPIQYQFFHTIDTAMYCLKVSILAERILPGALFCILL